METALTVVLLLVIGVAVHAGSSRSRLPAPLLLILIGFALSYLPFVADIEPTPHLVLLGLLPPLLYAAALGASEGPSEQYAAARARMLAAERAEVLRLRAEGTLDQSILARVLAGLDVEESILARKENRVTDAERSRSPLHPQSALCEHLDSYCDVPDPRTPWGCEECLRDGTDWVHLRLCLRCGHVGCCDSSVGAHATAHFGHTGHPVMRSFEPGESWRWCYVDEILG